MMFAVFLVLAVIGSASARCDNSCSGHGTCNFDEVCECFDNWGIGMGLESGDCSERICPFELAWVDTPDEHGNTHKYAECAGKGICDRDSGECECFEGYEGKGCQRSSCPSLCSGHGTCEYIEDLTYSGEILDVDGDLNVWNDARESFAYRGWDKHKVRGCVCDAQYADVDCSKRMCPYGTDVLDTRDNLVNADKHQTQRIEFVAREKIVSGGDATHFDLKTIAGQTFAISFRSKLNETFTTIPIVFDDLTAVDGTDMCNDIRLALRMLPNKVIDDVTCSVVSNADMQTAKTESGVGATAGHQTFAGFDITFTGDSVQGDQHLLWIEDYECANGCMPKITGLDIVSSVHVPDVIFDGTDLTAGGSEPSGTKETQPSDFNSYECGRRGKCDYDAGLCECFAGYFGESCNELTNLV
jgi:hypothetical protein